MRGIPYAQIPTTLLAMVDASVGGKTGVDAAGGKNLVGAFHAPVAVVVDPLTLDTLPLHERRGAFAEILKHGIIAEAAYFSTVTTHAERLLRELAHESNEFVELLTRSIAIKANVVRRDEREQGLRKVLNFGHTIAHGIETASHFSIAHGDAVAMGMAIEADLGERLGVTATGTAIAIRQALQIVGLPFELPPDLDAAAVLAAARHDKKNRRGQIEFALPARIGEMAGESSGWSVAASDEEILNALEAL
jgi:3-dehydroquinate synthase